MCNYNFIDIRDISPFHLNALKGKVCAHICSRSLLSNGKEKQRVQGSKIFIFLSVVSVSVFPFVHPFICLSVVSVSVCPFIHPFRLSAHLSLCPAIYLRPKDGQIAILTQGCVLALRKESHGGALESHVLTAAYTQNTKQHT